MIICQSQQLTVHNLTTRPTVINYPTNDQPTNMSSCEAPYISGMSHHARHPDLILHYFFFEGLITIVFSLSYFLTNYHEHTAYVSHLVKVCVRICVHMITWKLLQISAFCLVIEQTGEKSWTTLHQGHMSASFVRGFKRYTTSYHGSRTVRLHLRWLHFLVLKCRQSIHDSTEEIPFTFNSNVFVISILQ